MKKIRKRFFRRGLYSWNKPTLHASNKTNKTTHNYFSISKFAILKKKKKNRSISKEDIFKVIIYNYIFVGFNSVPNLIVILLNLMYPIFHVRFICKGCVWERESVKT